MITVTEAARSRLLGKLAKKEATDDQAMRFKRRQGGWKLDLDREAPADTKITHKGRTVLILDEAVSKAMTGMTLDAKDTDDGPRLTLLHPTKE